MTSWSDCYDVTVATLHTVIEFHTTIYFSTGARDWIDNLASCE